jgi:hypothetical protein
MTARTRDSPAARARQPVLARQSWSAEHQTGRSVTARLAVPCKLLRFSRLATTQYKTSHMEWRFYSVKPATGAAGVPPGYTTATATHNPPQIFYLQLAPFALALRL